MKFLETFKHLNVGLNEIFTILTSFPILDANGRDYELLKNKLAYPSDNFQKIESFYEPIFLKTKESFSTLKQSCPNDEETTGTKTMLEKLYADIGKELK